MLSRINILGIVYDHFKTLRKLGSQSKRIYWADFLLFIVVPALAAALFVFRDISIKNYTGNLIAAVAIFGGFLFNLLAIIYSQIDKIRDDARQEDSFLKKKFVREIHVNISYSIVLSLTVIICLLICTVEIPRFHYDFIAKKLLLGFTYFLLGKFLLTLLMVLNRVYILLKKDSE